MTFYGFEKLSNFSLKTDAFRTTLLEQLAQGILAVALNVLHLQMVLSTQK